MFNLSQSQTLARDTQSQPKGLLNSFPLRLLALGDIRRALFLGLQSQYLSRYNNVSYDSFLSFNETIRLPLGTIAVPGVNNFVSRKVYFNRERRETQYQPDDTIERASSNDTFQLEDISIPYRGFGYFGSKKEPITVPDDIRSEEEVDIEETIDEEIHREDDYYNVFDRGKSRLLVLLFGTKGNIGKLPFIDFGKTVRPRTLRLEIIPELRKALLLLLSIVKVSPQKKQSTFRGYNRQKQAQDKPYKLFSGALDLSKSIPIITNREGKELYRYNPDLFYPKTSDKLQDFVSRVLAQWLDVLEILDSDNKQVIRLLDRARRENQAIKGKRQTVKVLLERKVFKSTNVEAKAVAVERDLRKAQKQLKDTQAESIEAIANIVTLINKLRKCSDPNDLERVIRCILRQYFELYQESVLTTVTYYYQQRAEASSRAPPLELFYSGVLRDKLTELIARLGTT